MRKTMKALAALVFLTAAAKAANPAPDPDKPKGPEPLTFTCAMRMDYEEKAYSAIPYLGGLTRIVVDGSATITCPGRDEVTLHMHGAGYQAGLQVPSGLNPFVHKGKRVSGSFNVRVPSLFSAREFEGSYFYTGASTPLGGAETSPFLNSNGETDVMLFMPKDLDLAAGVHFKVITLKR
jgi:hypothetical protein